MAISLLRRIRDLTLRFAASNVVLGERIAERLRNAVCQGSGYRLSQIGPTESKSTLWSAEQRFRKESNL